LNEAGLRSSREESILSGVLHFWQCRVAIAISSLVNTRVIISRPASFQVSVVVCQSCFWLMATASLIPECAVRHMFAGLIGEYLRTTFEIESLRHQPKMAGIARDPEAGKCGSACFQNA